MAKEWNETTVSNKILSVIRIVASICVIILAALQLFGVWGKAIHLAVPLMGIVLLIQSIQEWKPHRSIAILGLCAALFIFGCAIVVWFF